MTQLPVKQLQQRSHLNYRPLSRLSMDLNVMPKLYKDHKLIICIIDEVTNDLITVPIYHSRSEEIGDALIEDVISKYCIPDYIIMYQQCIYISSYELLIYEVYEVEI